MKAVIIGAGPTGLYTALRLFQEGVTEIVVYDPRAGNYIRPGHLSRATFDKVQEGLYVKFWQKEQGGHIKDIEKGLYDQAYRLKINIEKKRFVRLHKEGGKPGVVVADVSGKEEIIATDYVFDCTGSTRAVVAAVNKIDTDSSLKLTTFADLPIDHHFLAYVKIDEAVQKKLKKNYISIIKKPQRVTREEYIESITKLRALGWKDFGFPRCPMFPFGKNKICLYLHTPENLSKENYDRWVQTVLECYMKPIHYEHLSSSVKPQFLPFTTSAQMLQEVSYRGKNLPWVIALGDAQIDFDYHLENGIIDGVGRIDVLFKYLHIRNGEIISFDSLAYRDGIKELMDKHKKKIIDKADTVKVQQLNGLLLGKSQFEEAVREENSAEKCQEFNLIIKEINARLLPLWYRQASDSFAKCHNAEKKVQFNSDTKMEVFAQLKSIHQNLLNAYHIDAAFAETRELLGHLVLSWKEIGNTLSKEKSTPEALHAYRQALEIYSLGALIGNPYEKLTTYADLIIVLMDYKSYTAVIIAANKALLLFASCGPESLSLQEKIVFNLIKALCSQAQVNIKIKPEKAMELRQNAVSLFNNYQNQFTSENSKEITAIMSNLEKQFKPENELSTASNITLFQPAEQINKNVKPETNIAAI